MCSSDLTSYPQEIQRSPQEDSRFREKDPKRPPSKDDERRGSKVPNSAPTGSNRIQISTMPKKDDLRNRPSVENPVPGSAERAKKSRGIGTFVDRQRAKLNETPQDRRDRKALDKMNKKK